MATKDETPQQPVTPTDAKKEGEGGKVFTQEELDTIINNRLEREKKVAKAELDSAIAHTKTETERLAALSQEEKQKELLAKQSKETEEREKTLTLRENKLDAQAKLDELKIPIKFADFVLDIDKEKMEGKIKVLSDSWNDAIKEGVSRQLAGNPPKDFSKNNSTNDKPKLVQTF